MEKDTSINDKLEYLAKTAREWAKAKGLPKIQPIDNAKLAELPYTPDAQTYLSCIWQEANSTPRYGDNRRSDPVDTSEHNKAFASSKIKEGISPRAWGSIKYFASMLAGYLGDREVDIHHVQAVAPYVLAHRLEFTDDYRAKFAEQRRVAGEREEQDLTRRLLAEIKKNYDDVHRDLKLLDAFLQGGLSGRELDEVYRILKGPEPDHPLLKIYYQEAKKEAKVRRGR